MIYSPQTELDKCLDRFDRIRNSKGETNTAKLRLSMQKTMQKQMCSF